MANDPFANVKWPEPAINQIGKLELDIIHDAKFYKDTQLRESKWSEILKDIRWWCDYASRHLIPLAEEFLQAPGVEKHKIVTETVIAILNKLEKQVNFFPPGVQWAAFRVIRWGVGNIVQKVFDKLRAAGHV